MLNPAEATFVVVQRTAEPLSRNAHTTRWLIRGVVFVALTAVFLVLMSSPADAQVSDLEPTPTTSAPEPSPAPLDGGETLIDGQVSDIVVPEVPGIGEIGFTIQTDSGGLSNSVLIVLLLTVGSIAPAILLLTTSFTRFIIVLSLTRNAIGAQAIPPNQVLIGLSLFLTMFVMGPILSQINDEALQPMLAGELSQSEAFDAGFAPLQTFMLAQTDEDDLQMFLELRGDEAVATPEDISPTVLIPSFVLSELKTAFVIGFVIFIPFLVIDLVVSSVLMSMGMVMLPPVFISLPVKLLLFVLVDGWGLIVGSLVASVNTV